MGPLRSMDSTASATYSTERSTRVDAHTVHHGTSDMEAVREEGEGWSRAFLLEHDSMDLVIMNSAFTRPTNHEAREPPCPRSEGSGRRPTNRPHVETASVDTQNRPLVDG